jgi:Ca2+-binding EF-hand superfamily protein
MLDTDGNGQLSREEYEAGFDRLDSDQDGVLLKGDFMSCFPSPAFQDR